MINLKNYIINWKILDKDKIYNFLNALFLIITLLLFIDSFFYQIQMFFFDGRIPLRHFLKPILLFSLFISFLIKRKFSSYFFNIWLATCLYTFFHSFYLHYYLKYDWNFIIMGYNNFYFYFYIIPFIPSVSGIISMEKFIKINVFLFVLVSIVGLLQIIFNASVLPLASIDGYFKMYSYSFYGNIRPFSFFGLPAFFAQYMVFMFIFFLFKIKFKFNVNFWDFIFLFLSMFFVYRSYIRTSYLGFIFAFVTASLFLYFGFKKEFFKRYTFIPIVYFFAGLFLIFYLIVVNKDRIMNNSFFLQELKSVVVNLENNQNIEKKKILDENNKNKTFKYFNFENISASVESPSVKSPSVESPDSFIMRILEWKVFGSMIFRDLTSFMFGYGYFQNDKFEFLNGYCVDNLYLLVFLHSGFLGFTIIFAYMWVIWIYILKNSNLNFFNLTIISVFSAFPITSFFQGMLGNYLLYFIFYFLIFNKEKYDLH